MFFLLAWAQYLSCKCLKNALSLAESKEILIRVSFACGGKLTCLTADLCSEGFVHHFLSCIKLELMMNCSLM